jgi:hypothetical protein
MGLALFKILCLQDLTPIMGSHFRATSIVELSEGTRVAFSFSCHQVFLVIGYPHIGVVVGGWNGLSTKRELEIDMLVVI